MAADAVDHLEHAAQAARHAAEGAAAHGAAAHEAGHGGIPELPNAISLLSNWQHDNPLFSWLHHWENLVFASIVAIALCAVAWRFGRKPALIPSGGQNLLETLVDGIDKFVHQVIGRAGRQHTPFIGSLFLFIWFMNLSVLIPGMKSSTSSLNTTVALAVVVFVYVQGVGMTSNGPLKYFDHLAGSPRDLVGWLLVPLMLPLHVIGECIKPLSLSLRLGFNVFAEDVLLAVLVGLGMAAGVALHWPGGQFTLGLPLQCFVIPLVLIFSTVQALVFSLLSSVYISLMLPHGEHHHE